MTRINVIEPSFLVDQHMMAEHREITRLPNMLVSGRMYKDSKIPDRYTLGDGHMKFFINKIKYLQKRHAELHKLLLLKGFNVQNIWPEDQTEFFIKHSLYNDFKPSAEDIFKNATRIMDRFPKAARMDRKPISKEEYISFLKFTGAF